MKPVLRVAQRTHDELAQGNGVAAGERLLTVEGATFLPVVAPVLADILRTVEEGAMRLLAEAQMSARTGTPHGASDTQPRPRARYAFD